MNIEVFAAIEGKPVRGKLGMFDLSSVSSNFCFMWFARVARIAWIVERSSESFTFILSTNVTIFLPNPSEKSSWRYITHLWQQIRFALCQSRGVCEICVLYIYIYVSVNCTKETAVLLGVLRCNMSQSLVSNWKTFHWLVLTMKRFGWL